MKWRDTKRCPVIGLDGATWDVIRPLADDGKLPTIKKLMETGVSGRKAQSWGMGSLLATGMGTAQPWYAWRRTWESG